MAERNLCAIWGRSRRHHDTPEVCAIRTWEDAMPTPPRRRQRRADGLSGALGRADLAAEFLRRNHTYRAEHAQMQQSIASGAVARNTAEAAFARRWGLSFRDGAG
ncbi:MULTISPECIES: transcriptional regulator domain-containing protein [Sphingomonas]